MSEQMLLNDTHQVQSSSKYSRFLPEGILAAPHHSEVHGLGTGRSVVSVSSPHSLLAGERQLAPKIAAHRGRRTKSRLRLACRIASECSVD